MPDKPSEDQDQDQRINELLNHPLLAQVLADIPEERREVILNRIVSKKAYPRTEDDAAFVLFTAAAMAYIDEVIDRVLDALE